MIFEENAVAEENKSPYTTGWVIFGILMVLTIVEYFVANLGSAVLLIIIAIAKAGLIMNYFMHIYRLWRTEEEHH